MQVDRNQFLEQGYLILRNVIPPNELDELRACYEILVERQRAIWARDRMPTDPPGGVWETSPQPRLSLNPGGKNGSQLIDRETANAVEFWLHENTQGVSSQLMDVGDDCGYRDVPDVQPGSRSWARKLAPGHPPN